MYLWRFRARAKDPGWNLTADEGGCRSLLALLDRFIAARYSCSQTIVLTKPDRRVQAMPNFHAEFRDWSSRAEWLLRYRPDIEPGTWELSADERVVQLLVGLRKLAELRDGVLSIAESIGDYAIGPDDEAVFDEQRIFLWGRLWGLGRDA
ncbi:MAG: hypothetical protein KIS87_00390 [Phycisphaeraceae bacterium]|nr:hypothetical protein [Phycisphaeraceae bacterium]